MLIPFHELTRFFVNGSPRGVIHIGAHKAEELEGYVSLGISTIAWIEANPNKLGDLISRTATHPGSTVHWFAAHERDGEIVSLNIANNGESSSILELGTHKSEHPHIHYVGKVNVPARTIDTFLKASGFDPLVFDFVNIDIQGAELMALRGMREHLKNVKYFYLEVNERPLYEGCALIQEIDEFLSEFSFKRELTKLTQHGWGDALYIKK